MSDDFGREVHDVRKMPVLVYDWALYFQGQILTSKFLDRKFLMIKFLKAIFCYIICMFRLPYLALAVATFPPLDTDLQKPQSTKF